MIMTSKIIENNVVTVTTRRTMMTTMIANTHRSGDTGG